MTYFKSVAIAAAIVVAATLPAAAKCTRLGFSVNDYGKDGPTKDAKQLLDQYIAKWAADHKIAKYTVGKKDVKCDLFLDLIVFDEHTCRAEASVCWTEAPGQVPYNGPAPGTAAAKPEAPAGEKKAAKPAVTKAAAKPAPSETGAISPPATPAPAKAKAATPADKAAAAADLAAAAAERAAAAAAAAEKAAAAASAKAAAPAPAAPAPAAVAPAPAAVPAAAPAAAAPIVIPPPKPAQPQ